jgi:hypothetical protein
MRGWVMEKVLDSAEKVMLVSRDLVLLMVIAFLLLA